MKALLAILAILTLAARAAEIELEWDAYDPPQAVAAWHIYERAADGTVTRLAIVPGGTLTMRLEFAVGTHTVFHRAADSEGAQSDPSEPLTFQVLPKPGKPRIKVALQASNDLGEWTDLAVIEEEETGRRFYRIAFTASH